MGGDQGLEEVQGKNIVDACKNNGVKHVIYSGLESVVNISKGKLDKVLHFDGKARIVDYLKSKGLAYTDVQAGCYNTNLIYFFPGHPIVYCYLI